MSTHHQRPLTPNSAARALHQQSQLEVLLHQIVLAARDTIPGAEYAGVTIGWDPDKIGTVAASDPIVYQLDEIQYELGEGPIVDAVSGRRETLAQDVPMNLRWPGFAAEAERLGIASHIVRPVYNLPGRVGLLELYSSEPDAFGPEASYLVTLVVAEAAHSLARTGSGAELLEALSARKVISQAIGIVMGRHQVTEQAAYAFLIDSTRTSNIELHLLAARLVSETERKAVPSTDGQSV